MIIMPTPLNQLRDYKRPNKTKTIKNINIDTSQTQPKPQIQPHKISMQRLIVGLALVSLVADARRWRQRLNFGEDPEGIAQEDIVCRRDKPTGLEALDDEQDEENQFLRWIIHFGKNYKDLVEWKDRLGIWRAFNREIRENNTASELSGNPNAPFMDHNKMSDLTLQEKERMLGLAVASQEIMTAESSRGQGKRSRDSWKKSKRDDSDSSDSDSDDDDRRMLQSISDDPIEYD